MKPMQHMNSSYDIVIFGGAGDLSFRKLLPALYMAHSHGKLDGETRIIGIGRQSWSRDQYLNFISEQSPPFIEANALKQEDWKSFLERLQFVQLDLINAGDYAKLKAVCV